MRSLVSLMAVSIALLSVQNVLADPPAAPTPPASEAPPPSAIPNASSFALTRMVNKIPMGAVIIEAHAGWLCVPSGKRTWPGGEQKFSSPPLISAFNDEMKKAGYKIDGDSDNIFEKSSSTSDIEVGAIFTDMHVDYCQKNIRNTDVHGTASYTIEWQIYSSIKKTILAKITTHGDYASKGDEAGGYSALSLEAFRANVVNLIASDDFRKAVTSAPLAGDGVVKPSQQTPIPLPGALAAGPRSINDAVKSVVMISAGDTQGSGFMVSADGMLLTDRHVVGDAKFVKVRWSDGVETLGEVVRTDKVRDVALLKTEPHGQTPLHLRRDAPQPADTVYAIGAPLDPKFQSTVTKGVMSASRTFEGLNYIQSDVSVNPGNSGGPLLNEKGEVIGITESGYRSGGAPSGINLFTPIGDGLDFLSATPQ